MEPSKEFLEKFATVVEALYPNSGLDLNGEVTHRINLNNAFREYQAAPDELRAEVLTKWARNYRQIAEEMRNGKTSKTGDLQHLFPIVRRRSYFTGADIQSRILKGGQPMTSKLWTRMLTPHFWIGLAVDDGKKINFLHEDEVAQLGKNSEEVYQLALENLRRDQPIDFREMESGIYMSEGGGEGHNASLILLPEFVEQQPVLDTPIVILSHADRIFMLDSGIIRSSLASMDNIVRLYHELPHPISLAPLFFAGGAWNEFSAVNSADPFYRAGRNWWLKDRLEDAENQRALMQQLYPNVTFPLFYSVGLDMSAAKEEIAARAITFLASETPELPMQPFFLSEILFYPYPNGDQAVLWLQALMDELPGVVQVDLNYEPPICRLTRALTPEDIERIIARQEPAFQDFAQRR